MRSAAVLGLAAPLAGCATSATGVKNARINSMTAPQKLIKNAPPGTVMATVRYPAFVEKAAEEKFLKLYAHRPIGSRLGFHDAGFEETAAIANIMLVKSNYFGSFPCYVASLYMPQTVTLLNTRKSLRFHKTHRGY